MTKGLAPGHLRCSWGCSVLQVPFPPPFSWSFSSLLGGCCHILWASPSARRGLCPTLSTHSWASLSSAMVWLSIPSLSSSCCHRQPHTPSALGLVRQQVPVNEGPRWHNVPKLFRERGGGWVAWLGGSLRDSGHPRCKPTFRKVHRDSGPSVLLPRPCREGVWTRASHPHPESLTEH